MAAPLIAGTNLVSASTATLSVLTNKAVIAVDQDSLGKQGREVSASGGLDVLAKPLANGDVSVALFNETGSTATISTTAAAIGKTGAASYTLTNLWTGATSATTGTISASVPAHGTVMYRVAGGGASTNPAGEIHAIGAAKCLDVPNSTQANGTQLDIWTCGGASNQIWTLASGQLTVYSGSSQKCLDAFNNQTTPGHQGGDLDLQRRGQPAMGGQLQRHHHRHPVRPVPGRHRREHRQRRPGRTVDMQRPIQPAMDPRVSQGVWGMASPKERQVQR